MEKKMPKQRITKEMVVEAAFEIARNDGMEQVLVKNIAEKSGCSVQPGRWSLCGNLQRRILTRQISLPAQAERMYSLQKRSRIYLSCSFCTGEKEFPLWMNCIKKKQIPRPPDLLQTG